MKKTLAFLVWLVCSSCLAPQLAAVEESPFKQDVAKVESVHRRKLIYKHTGKKVLLFYEDELSWDDTLKIQYQKIDSRKVAASAGNATWSREAWARAVRRVLKHKLKRLSGRSINFFPMMNREGDLVRLKLGLDPEALAVLTSADIDRMMRRIKREVKFTMPECATPYTHFAFSIRVDDLLEQ